jgi:TonB family protein
MRKFTLIILILCLLATFAVAQKVVRKQRNFPVTQKIQVADSPVKIISQPKAPYPNQFSGTIHMIGVVRLKVTFLETGQIGDISVISSLPYGATQNAIDAARKIKFQPAIKEGKSQTVSKTVEYRFSENSTNK